MPQWVHDEQTGPSYPPPYPPPWAPPSVPPPYVPPPHVPARRRRVGPALAVVLLVVVAAGAWWWTSGAPTLPSGVVSAASGLVRPAIEPPSAEVVALADAAYLSDGGRELLYGARPEILGAADFAGRCDELGPLPRVRADGSVGCFFPGAQSIVVYAPADPRLHGYAVETVAHEVLHAAWVRLTDTERAQVTDRLTAVVSALPADDPIHEQLAGSVGGRQENRPTELFAYVGTQVWSPGGLDPQVEAIYARFVTDRAALVAVHTGWAAMLDEQRAAIQAAMDAVHTQEQANADQRAIVARDAAGLDSYRQLYAAKVAEVDAMSAGERQRLRLSWEWWDGTELPMAPADETLDAAAALLARDEADLPARSAVVAAAEATTATERARVEALIADFDALIAQLDPALAAQAG